MKGYTILILLIFLAISCKDANQTPIKQKKTVETVTKETSTKSNSTYLCKINGKDWAYTKASGILSTHAKTKKRTALITFKKKLKKGSEHFQLTYDANTFQLIAASLQLKFPKKDGSLFTCYYDLKPVTRKRHPESELSGSIDLSNSSNASGVAEIKNLSINYEKGNLKNLEDAVLNITGLKFNNIGYSDTDNLFK
ncbi:MAG: hypothetical protein L3J14_04365 [Flavobacteriaceae bacterium]|nr:hypothetical protein [Flavobacteriaceae bacterium]